ncbi:acyl-coenzyme A amino acid N-acyltransferase 1-like [Saccostrea echinata]|uniref:acyl-coenzyme A amino acid N-acyltransferase 1-like n=1 Tax=Saccostrea echinata TaxID=191078 RepID=UPI002A7EC3F7|nr:acyl-coenzyme A amino acid N-acyltransferase 1-like [Saccostrea echinata]
MPEVRICVTPREALVDEEVVVRVDGLPKKGNITIKASLQEGINCFTSYGCYTATERGHVAVGDQASVQGTYTGVEPMGLFWSMKPEPKRPNARLLKKDVTTPMVVKFSVFEGHLTWKNLFDTVQKPLATLDVYRWYKHKSVRREEVKYKKIRGALFIPPGPGPFPGVIDLFGNSGGLIQHRAALLASRGFCVFALAYLAYDDLPVTLKDVSLDYFIDSARWFAGRPNIQSNRIGVLATSKGGMYALELCRHLSQIKAIALVNGVTFYADEPLKYKTEYIQSAPNFMNQVKVTNEGMDILGFYNPTDEYYIKAWESEACVLCIVGEDDHTLSYSITERFMELIPSDHQHRFELVKYPNAGHLIEPPYSPHCRVSFNRYNKKNNTIWGGHTKSHSYAQEDSWRRIIAFLSHYLKTDKHLQDQLRYSTSKL